MKDFWISSGHHLLDLGSDGGLHVTDEFLKLYLARPELIPPAEACAVERTLHAALLAHPRMPVPASDVDAIADADAADGVQVAHETALVNGWLDGRTASGGDALHAQPV